MDALPTYHKFQNFGKKNPSVKLACTNILNTYSKTGALNMSLLVKDRMIKPSRYKENDKIIPLTINKNPEADPSTKEITMGQHNDEKELDGFGRKMWVNQEGDAAIWEGQFKNGILHGFGRQLDILNQNGFNGFIGWWDEGKYHGYGTEINHDIKQKIEMGYFEQGIPGSKAIHETKVT
jgi:hypothetical protein